MGHHLHLDSTSSHLLQAPCHHHRLLSHHQYTFKFLKFEVPIRGNALQAPKASPFPFTTTPRGLFSSGRRRGKGSTQSRSSARESPYEVLGVSSSATPQEIRRAYRRLALKYHPDVNKEPRAQEKFVRIKHAYNTLINRTPRADYSSSRTQRDKSWRAQEEEEEFYGLGDLFRDLQAEFQNWESSLNSNEKPKSLWEELEEIGEEFVEFLEKELKVNEINDDYDPGMPRDLNNSRESREAGDAAKKEAKNEGTIKDSIDEIETALEQLKRELGL